MAKKKKFGGLKPEEAMPLLRRRMREWRDLTPERDRLNEKEKKLREEVKQLHAVVGEDVVEVLGKFGTPGIQSQIYEHVAPLTKDERNLGFLEGVLDPQAFARICPRVVEMKELRRTHEDLAEKLHARKSTKHRLDLVQAEAPSKAS